MHVDDAANRVKENPVVESTQPRGREWAIRRSAKARDAKPVDIAGIQRGMLLVY
jgi:hypothetical protein